MSTSSDAQGHSGADFVGPDRQAGDDTRFAPGDEFIGLFTKSQRRLYLFILSQVGRPNDAEEILQETNIVIWRKASKFELGSNFFAWASRIAVYEVLKHRERKGRDKLHFSPEFVESITEEAEAISLVYEERRKALATCLEKLRPNDRELITRRYAPGKSGKDIAETLGRPVNAVYQSIGRVRRQLLECINREVKSVLEPNYPTGNEV
ncbi:sigma-70 family RNA polymerase sigma factor [Stratiformator vulcanicus]|uniref:ECF RNA polymerase sigma factor SigE n=1 Tax=Stratiformator vulcanicus TaxID=2527980 RepID=A0A517R1M1_9PLAN|nr:sigma-70 family RNA polymerase sigma factor [Stratiformator vulcanicus]QDT37744.1 ECF RNA polymerase sigma factor SigE [Stratiformator vulcanicus]